VKKKDSRESIKVLRVKKKTFGDAGARIRLAGGFGSRSGAWTDIQPSTVNFANAACVVGR
jgi:hypothetical protein